MTKSATTARSAGAIDAASSDRVQDLRERYQCVRAFTESLCEPLENEDYVVQTMPDVSPTKWHLAHTTWFFETLVLKQAVSGYSDRDPEYAYLFNSYYNTLGEQYCRPKRGLLSRPTVEEVFAYRRHVDERMMEFFERSHEALQELWPVVEIGLNHEQQHQELMLTDIKHVFAANQVAAVYGGSRRPIDRAPELEWVRHDGGLVEIGHENRRAFCYDNELPRHKTYLEPSRLASRLVTCGEFLEFMRDNGYARPDLWLSDGWNVVQEEGWRAPLYWEPRDWSDPTAARDADDWILYTLAGRREIDPHEPVCHVSFYEADAFARWAGARLPREEEWELLASHDRSNGNFVEDGLLHPAPARPDLDPPQQMLGDAWEWTMSPYQAYPGYEPPAGPLAEYNSKFMCNQMVLRGGSCVTPRSHIRHTYRNFFPPEARWQFSGIRLAKDA